MGYQKVIMFQLFAFNKYAFGMPLTYQNKVQWSCALYRVTVEFLENWNL